MATGVLKVDASENVIVHDLFCCCGVIFNPQQTLFLRGLAMSPRSLLYVTNFLSWRCASRRYGVIQPSSAQATSWRRAWSIPQRGYALKTEADTKLEELQELYATAKDEFEMASEETGKKTIYAPDDRAAAQEELQKLKAAFDDAVKNSSPEVGAEIKARVGQRIRELDRAVEAMEEMAMGD
ncbi:hypothetical protein MMC11_006020 [Xylographa trunciseda]|nr:hypothetical protein [Xylographa trunciseda]